MHDIINVLCFLIVLQPDQRDAMPRQEEVLDGPGAPIGSGATSEGVGTGCDVTAQGGAAEAVAQDELCSASVPPQHGTSSVATERRGGYVYNLIYIPSRKSGHTCLVLVRNTTAALRHITWCGLQLEQGQNSQ